MKFSIKMSRVRCNATYSTANRAGIACDCNLTLGTYVVFPAARRFVRLESDHSLSRALLLEFSQHTHETESCTVQHAHRLSEPPLKTQTHTRVLASLCAFS